MAENPNETIKEAFLRIVKRETIELMEQSITTKFIKFLLIAWIIISGVGSVFRYFADRCDRDLNLDKYFYAKALCPSQPQTK